MRFWMYQCPGFSRVVVVLVAVICMLGCSAAEQQRQSIDMPVLAPAGQVGPPPEWALLQRQLLERLHPAAIEFVQRYTRPDGTLIWREEWPGMDGSDDGYESFYNFPLYYVLGGPQEMDALSRRLWDSVTRQFTAYGQIYKEFDGYYDWMHHGESYVKFYFFGLADPANRVFRERSLRFAGLYMNEEPEARNYDPELKLIRSPINGSRGPRFVNTAEDWVTHRPVLAKYPLPFDDIPNVTHSKAWIDDELFPNILETMNKRMMRGDVPLNLTTTSLILNAWMYSPEEKYREWVKEYVSAWMERVERNNGIIPDNVGLSGKIGEYMDGKWWGGYYGWRWPHGLFNQLESTLIAGMNAYLATGEERYLELPRSQLRMIAGLRREEKGRTVVPHRHGDNGWYDYRPVTAQYPLHLWYISQREEDWKLVEQLCNVRGWESFSYRKAKGDDKNEGPWVAFLQGKNPEFPGQVLRANYAESLRRLQMMRTDRTPVDDMDVHHWQQRNPVVLEGLVQTMMGGPNHIYHGGLLHVRLRYFDPERRRAGIPPDVAALVDRITADEVRVEFVNLHPSEPRELVVQAGAFGEHRFTRAISEAETVEVNNRHFSLRLPPGASARMTLGMERFVNQPTYALPWTAAGAGRR
jgi:hypothetical protein